MENEYFVCVPFNMLPAENKGEHEFLSDVVKKQRDRIRELIIGKDDKEIFKSEEAMKLIAQLGSDTNINAFALNWKDKHGNLNNDLEEANYFMKRVVDKLSITTANTDPTKIPIYLTSTKFEPDGYGECAKTFMGRLGVHKSDQDLFVLRNVVMSPFPTQQNFIFTLMQQLEKEITKEVEKVRERNEPGGSTVQFLVQGSASAPVFLIFQTSFHTATRRQQLILEATLDDKLKKFYESLGPEKIAILESDLSQDIEDDVGKIGTPGEITFKAKIYDRDSRYVFQALILGTKKLTTHSDHSESGTVGFKSIVKSRPLNSCYRDTKYPAQFMPFYLYGNKQELFIDHMLVTAPNIYLSASDIKFSPDLTEKALSLLEDGLILGLTEIPEAALQPFPGKNADLPKSFFFSAGKEFEVKVWKDPRGAVDAGPGLLDDLEKEDPVYTGKMTRGKNVLVDVEGPNKDDFAEKPVESDSWQKKLDEIGSMLDGTYGTECN